MTQTRAVVRAAERVVQALTASVAEGAGRQENKAAAEALVALRRQFVYEGRPDWAGRSGEYRDLVERLYRQAGVPSDSESSMQANLRYHLGNALRQVAPPEDLEALGMQTKGPLARVQQSRANNPRASRPRPAVIRPGDPASMARVAIDAVRALRTMAPGPEVIVDLRTLVAETEDLLSTIDPGN